MKEVTRILKIIIAVVIISTIFSRTVNGQDVQFAPKLFIGGGALSEDMYKEFLELTGTDAKLVVIPTASKDDLDAEKIKERWLTLGFSEISVLHTRDRNTASAPGFSEPLKTATAVWFSGGSQQRIADAYIGTPVEEELYKLLERGGVIGGTSAGAAIQSRIMIRGGKGTPKISTGLDLLPNAIIDQHFLKRNRLSRLMAAVRAHPDLTGYGIDEDTAIIVSNNEYRIAGSSYVLRIEVVEGEIHIDAYEDGDTILPGNDIAEEKMQKD